MTAYLRLFWGICLLRQRPDALPHSRWLLSLLLGLHVLLGAVIEVVAETPTRMPLLAALFSTAGMVAMTVLLLHVRGYLNRVVQTLTALAGCDLVIGLLLLPLLGLAGVDPAFVAALALAWFGLLLWNIAIAGHILRHAIEVPFWVGVFIAVGMVAVMMGVIGPLVLENTP